jgi:uncharacterized YccA/Bax inhibitor family protein
MNTPQRGRPVRGAVAGFFLGLFVALDLVVFGVLSLDSDVLALAPVLGIVAGVLLAMLAPFGRRSPQPASEPAARAA